MKKVLIIGDSHTAKLRNNLNVTFSEKCVWKHEKKIKSNCIDNHLNVLYEKEITIYFSYHNGQSAYKGYAYDNDKYPCIHQLISDEFIILPWFGYIDVKQFLPMKDKESPEVAAKRYVECWKEFMSVRGDRNNMGGDANGARASFRNNVGGGAAAGGGSTGAQTGVVGAAF